MIEISEVKTIVTKRIDNNETTPERETFHKHINLLKIILMNASVSIRTLEEMTDKKYQREVDLFCKYSSAFTTAVYGNFWAQSVIDLHEFFNGRDFTVRKLIKYARANWNKIFTAVWKEEVADCFGQVIEENLITFNRDDIFDRLDSAEKLLIEGKENIDKIKTLRDKVYAHIDKEPANVRMKVAELREIYMLADKIFNLLTGLYDKTHTITEPTNSNDVRNLVRVVEIYDEYHKEIRELRHREVEEEMEKYFAERNDK